MKSKHLRHIISIMVILTMVLSSMLYSFADSDSYNEHEDYIKIYTKQDLCNINDNLSGNYILMRDIHFHESDFEYGGDFYNGGQGWRPIGVDNYQEFTGEFDGDGHTIDGLYINAKSYNEAGLFVANDGIIGNLHIKNAEIYMNTPAKEEYAGGIAGANYFMILGCSFDGIVQNNSKAFQSENGINGGIAGFNSGTILNCNNGGYIQGQYASGGIAGWNSDGTVQKCYNTGEVRGRNTDSCAGGIAGLNRGNIIESYNTGRIHTVLCNDIMVDRGGIAGMNAGNIQECYNTGKIETDTKSKAVQGGICGDNLGSVRDCYNTGNIYGGFLNGGLCALTGFQELEKDAFGTVENSYNTGYVQGGANNYGIGLVDSGEITNAYFLNNVKDGGCMGAKRCSSSDMKKKATYKGFDFNKTWIMNSDSLPTLKNVTKSRLVKGIERTKISLKSNFSNGKISLTWKKSPGYKLDGYEVYRSYSKTKGYSSKPLFKTSRTKYTNSKGLKAGKRYYYKVRGYRIINGLKVYTNWSNIVSRTIR